VSYMNCIKSLAQAAGRELTDAEVQDVYERVHKAALDIKAGRAEPGSDVRMPKQLGLDLQGKPGADDAQTLVARAAERAAAELEAEAANIERNAHLQLVRMSARMADVDGIKAAGLKPLDAVKATIARDYTGKVKVESLEQRVIGYRDYLNSKLLPTWDALGNDWMGFLQDRDKLLTLVRQLRGEETGDALAKKGADAFHTVAEEARQSFNENGGVIGKLDDWGMPQHHSQEKVAAAGKEAWLDEIMPRIERQRYVDDLGEQWNDAQMREFLGKAWDTIATNGIANLEPGKSMGKGGMAGRHAEERQIHFKSAEDVIAYWETFGEKTVLEVLQGHVETMARDIAFVEHFGPNPNTTYRTLRDAALKEAAMANPTQTPRLEGEAVGLDNLWDYAAGRMKPTYRQNLKAVADGVANLNTAGKLGGAAVASFFGDKAMMEAVAHLNNLPMFNRWSTELSLLNPTNSADRRLLQQQGLMLDSVRSGLQRFYEGLGKTGTTGRIANAVMRITGMSAINDIRKGAFGISLMSAIGDQIKAGVKFENLQDSDIRTLRQYGIQPTDWNTWQLAQLQDMGNGNKNVLTPEAIGRIPDAALEQAGIVQEGFTAEQARRAAIVKLLGAVNTESEFAIVTPGWRERATFYGDLQRGTIKGEIARSVLQFKAFPWAMLQRGMDAVANAETGVGKAVMTSYLIASTTLLGAMLIQTREMLSGKDPRAMNDREWWKFWGAAFLQGGALGIYGDFLSSTNQTRYGTGPLEVLAGPTVGPLLELGLVQPMNAAKKRLEGKETHLAAQTIQDLKGFVPGNNIWYTKAALDHLIWQRVMEMLSPGYLATIRQKTMKEYGQEWYWRPGEMAPERGPDLERAWK